VIMTLVVTESGTAKPSEIATLLGYDPGAVNHRVRRLEIQWQ
jgi:DNA-binding MarR family transcriptional regulator